MEEYMLEKLSGYGFLFMMAIQPIATDERLEGTWTAVPELQVTWSFYNVDEVEPDVWWIRKDGFWSARIRGEETSYLEYAARGGRILARPDESYKWIPLGSYYIAPRYSEVEERIIYKKGYLFVDLGVTGVNLIKIDE